MVGEIEKAKLLKSKSAVFSRSNLFLLLPLMLFAAFVLFNNLGGNVPLYYDEALYSVMDLDSLHDDGSLLFPAKSPDLPTYYKPPLKTWLKYPILKILGFNPFTLRLLDAVMGLITVFLIYIIGTKLFERWIGFAAGFIFITFNGLLLDYWARVNAFDAGIVLGTVLFFYFFLFRYNEKLSGAVACGLALAFVFYFKHIAAFIPLFIGSVYLLIMFGIRGIISRHYAVMLLAFAIPVLAWHLPYFIMNPDIFSYFLNVEVKKRIFGGFKSQYGYRNVFAYFSSVASMAGAWLWWILPGIGYALFSFARKKCRKGWIIVLWFFIPFVLLTISASRLPRYLFPAYPALAILLGFSVVNIPRWAISGWDKKRRKVLFRITGWAVAAAILVTSVVAIVRTVHSTRTFRNENCHALAALYREGMEGSIYLSERNMKRYNWLERISLASVSDRLVDGQPGYEGAIIRKLQENDCYILYRWELARFIYFGDPGDINFDKYRFFSFTGNPERFKSTRKIVLFLKGSGIDRFFSSINLIMHPLRDYRDIKTADDSRFIEKLSELTFGFDLEPRAKVEYYVNAIRNGFLTRDEIVNRFTCYERYYTPRKFPRWWKDRGEPESGKGKFHHLVDFYRPDRSGSIQIIGITEHNFTANMLCYLERTIPRWVRHEDGADLHAILAKLAGGDVMILRRSTLIRFIGSSEDIPEISRRKFYLLTLKGYKGEFMERDRFFNIVAVLPAGGQLNEYLASQGVSLQELRPLSGMIKWNVKDEREFLEKTAELILGSSLLAARDLDYLDALRRGKMTRREVVSDLLSKAADLDY